MLKNENYDKCIHKYLLVSLEKWCVGQWTSTNLDNVSFADSLLSVYNLFSLFDDLITYKNISLTTVTILWKMISNMWIGVFSFLNYV